MQTVEDSITNVNERHVSTHNTVISVNAEYNDPQKERSCKMGGAFTSWWTTQIPSCTEL